MKTRIAKIVSETEFEIARPSAWFFAGEWGFRVIDYHALLFGRPKPHSVGDEVELILPERITNGALVCVPYNKSL